MPIDSRELVNTYLNKVLEVNKTHNLTSITDYSEAMLLHIEDSLAVLPELQEAPSGLYGDLGSGGGFPGVPLAICSGREAVLFDSVQKKMKAVQDIVDALCLPTRISTFAGRIEEYSKLESFSVLTARALTSLPSLLELATPLLTQGGQLIALKAQISEEELEQGICLENKLGMRLVKDRSYTLPGSDVFRRVLVFEKFKEPEISLPRRVGKAQKSPLRAV